MNVIPSIEEIKRLIQIASGGIIDSTDFDSTEPLVFLGYNSISMLTLFQLLEDTYDIGFDPESDLRNLGSAEQIHNYTITNQKA